MSQSFRQIIILFSFLVIGLTIYGPSFHAPFQLDDYYAIVTNYVVTNMGDIPAIWREDPSRFLTHFTFAFNYYFAGLDVFGYHGFNFVIHFLTTIIVFMLIQVTLRNKNGGGHFTDYEIRVLSYIGALIFLTHPLQTSAVSYVAQRATLLATFSYLLSLLTFIYFRQSHKLYFYVISIFVFGLGLFTKPIIMTLPVMMIIYEKYFITPSIKMTKRDSAIFIPYFILASLVPILLILWKYKALELGHILDVTKETETISRVTYLLTQISVLVTYLRLFILPINQNLDYDYPLVYSLWNAKTFFSLLILGFLLGVAVKSFRRNRLISFGIIWFFVTLAIESSIFPIKDVIFEHRLYLPMFGFVLFLVALFKKLFVYPMIGRILTLLIVLEFSLLTFDRNLLWSNRIQFLTDIVLKSPNKGRAYNNLGFAYFEEKDFLNSWQAVNRAIALDPHYALAYCNRGRIYQQFHQFPQALSDYAKALSLRADYPEVYNNRGNIYMAMGEHTKALEDFDRTISFNPYFAAAFLNRGIIHQNEGRLDAALRDYNQAIKLKSDFAEGYNNRGIVFTIKGEYNQAFSDFDRAILLKPDYEVARQNRALALKKQKNETTLKNHDALIQP